MTAHNVTSQPLDVHDHLLDQLDELAAGALGNATVNELLSTLLNRLV
jgi:hypothetical protein